MFTNSNMHLPYFSEFQVHNKFPVKYIISPSNLIRFHFPIVLYLSNKINRNGNGDVWYS